jgi:hypothetical protein
MAAAPVQTPPPVRAVAAPQEMRPMRELGLQQVQATPRQGGFPAGATRHAQHGVPMASLYDHAPARGFAPEPKGDLKEIAREIGVLEYQNDEYDIPTFLRKQAD